MDSSLPKIPPALTAIDEVEHFRGGGKPAPSVPAPSFHYLRQPMVQPCFACNGAGPNDPLICEAPVDFETSPIWECRDGSPISAPVPCGWFAECRMEPAGELRQVAEAGFQRDLQHRCGPIPQACRGRGEATAQDVAVRRHASDLAKHGREVAAAHPD